MGLHSGEECTTSMFGLKMEVIQSFKILVTTYNTIQCHDPDDFTPAVLKLLYIDTVTLHYLC
jgi:hypothetical protein